MAHNSSRLLPAVVSTTNYCSCQQTAALSSLTGTQDHTTIASFIGSQVARLSRWFQWSTDVSVAQPKNTSQCVGQHLTTHKTRYKHHTVTIPQTSSHLFLLQKLVIYLLHGSLQNALFTNRQLAKTGCKQAKAFCWVHKFLSTAPSKTTVVRVNVCLKA